jgi:superfamily I DNA/RNA helicase
MEEAGLSFEENNLRRIKGIISYAKINMVDPDAVVPGPGERFDDASVTVYRSYQAALKIQRSLDYDDMLVYAHRLFKEDAAALKRYQEIYRYILVDEFQDTSSLQYRSSGCWAPGTVMSVWSATRTRPSIPGGRPRCTIRIISAKISRVHG